MRVPTLYSAQSTLQALQKRESDQARLQSQVASGVRVQTPSDDPVAAAQAELARARVAHLKQDQRAAQLAQGTLSAADGALGQGVDLLQSAREALVAAGDGSYTADDRHALALQLRQTRAQLLAVANTSDGAGGYVFGGQGAGAAPFSANPVAYGAAAGTQQVAEDGHFATTVDGRAAFLSVPQGNGVFVTASNAGNAGTGWIAAGSVGDATQLTGHAYAIAIGGSAGALTYSATDTTTGASVASNVAFRPGDTLQVQGQSVAIGGTPAPGDGFLLAPAGRQSIFATLDDAIAMLENDQLPSGAYQEQLQRVQTGLDRGLDALQLARSSTGAQLRGLDDATAASSQQQHDATQRLGSLRDLDMAQGISDLQQAQTGYEAALKSYATLGRLSLISLLS